MAEGFLNTKERMQKYMSEYQQYKENKKETYDRNKLFYVLEKYFAKTKEEQ